MTGKVIKVFYKIFVRLFQFAIEQKPLVFESKENFSIKEIGMTGFGLSSRRKKSRTAQDTLWANRRFNLENDFL